MSNAMKPIVHYDTEMDHFIGVGTHALVFPIDHPNGELVSNTTHIITSLVQVYNESTGEFETQNTVYKPMRIR